MPFFDSLALTRHLGAVPSGRLDAVGAYLARHGVQARTALLPTDVPGVHVALTSVIGRAGDVPVTATGARAGSSLADCASASLREAVQVHSALLGLLALPGPLPAPAPVVDEVTRARACLSPVMAEHFQQWLAHSGLQEPSPSTLPDETARPSLEQLVDALVRRELRPVFAELTPRLPDPVRSAGWSVVRAVVLGHQPYRMDDTEPWSTNAARLADWRSRLDTPDEGDPVIVGHPLI